MPREQQEENLQGTPSLEKSISTSLQSPIFTLEGWPQENWWEIFNSPQLDALIGEALEQNPSISEVESRIEFAKQEAKVARARLFPYISFDGDLSKEYLSKNGLYRALNPKIPLNANLIDLSFSLDYEFDFWSKNYNLFLAAFGEKLAREAEAAQVRLSVSTSVAQAYFALKANLLRKKFFLLLYEISEANYKLQNFMAQKALSSRIAPLLLQESYFEAKKQLLGIEQEIVINKHLLNYLLGRGPDAPLEIDDALPPLPAFLAIPDNLSLDLIARRPDLTALIWRVKTQAYKVGAAIADFYPNVNLSGLVGLESVTFARLFQWSSKTYKIEPAFHLPIFTAGAIQANVDANKAAFDEAVFGYNNLVLVSVQEVADLLVISQTVYEQKSQQEHIVEFARARYDLTKLRQGAGLDSRFEDFKMQTELVTRELENINLLYAQYVAAVKLIKALGGGYYSEYCIPLQACGDDE